MHPIAGATSRTPTATTSSVRAASASCAEAERSCTRICDPPPMDSLAGKLLVSSPSLLDPNFRRTVVLMTHHDEEGAMGLVLSRPSPLSVADTVPNLADFPGAD